MEEEWVEWMLGGTREGQHVAQWVEVCSSGAGGTGRCCLADHAGRTALSEKCIQQQHPCAVKSIDMTSC